MKKIISMLLAVSILFGAIPAFAKNDDDTEVTVKSPWDSSEIEAAPTPVQQSDVYYIADETEEEENYEPIVHTETIPDDIELPEEEYNLMGEDLPSPYDISLFSDTNNTGSIWSEVFSSQFGDDYLKPYEKKADGQKISGNTNRLTIEETDLSLPGKNGLDVVLKRRHDNQDYNEVYSAYYGAIINTYQQKYLVAFTNTSTNKRIYIAFYTEDDFYTYMYNGSRLNTLSSDKLKTCNIGEVTYSYYDYIYIRGQITDDESCDYYKYDDSVKCMEFNDIHKEGSRYDIEDRRLFLNNNTLGNDWIFIMPEVSLYKYSSTKTNDMYDRTLGTAYTEYFGEYVGAFRDLDGNIYSLEGHDFYNVYDNYNNTYTSSFSSEDNHHLKFEKLFKTQTLDNGIKYNFVVIDNRGYKYYLYNPTENPKEGIWQLPEKKPYMRISAIEDAYGNRIIYEYDSEYSNITKIIDTYGREINISHTSGKTVVSYYDDIEGETKTITYETSTLPSSALDNDSPIKPKDVRRFTVTNQLGEQTIYDARETKVINVFTRSARDITGYPEIYLEEEYHSKNSNIERIIYPTGAETRYKYQCIYPYSPESQVTHGAYAVVASYDMVDGKEVNKKEYSFTNNTSLITITGINDGEQSKTVSEYNKNGLLTSEKITPIKGSSTYQSTTYTYNDDNKPLTVTVNNNGLKNTTTYAYVSKYPELLSGETTNRNSISYTYHKIDDCSTDKIKTITYTNKLTSPYTKYTISTELTEDNKSIEYERVTQNDVLKSQTKYEYDSEGNVTAAKQWTSDTNGDGVLDENDEYTTVTSTYTNTTAKTKDIINTVADIKNADGVNEGSVTNEYKLNIYGYPTYNKDSYGTVTTINYDALNRPVKYNLPNGSERAIEYNSQKNYTIVTDETGIQYKYYYDGLGRITKKTRMYGGREYELEKYSYDTAGRLSEKNYGQKGTSKIREVYTYDCFNRVITKNVYEGTSKLLYTENYTYTYNSKEGKVTKSTIAADGTETADVITYYDQYGQAIKTEAVSSDTTLTTEAEYDYMGRVAKETDANGNDTAYEYTYDGQVCKVTYPDSTSVTTQYNLAGQAVSVTDANGNTTVTDYDKIGRAIKTTAPFDGTRNAITKTYYDKNSNVIKKAVRKISEVYQTEEYKYDNMGNLTAAISGDSGEQAVTQYQYDSANRMTKMITGLSEYSANPSGGSVTTYEYGKDGFVSKIIDPLGADEEFFDYDAYGNISYKYDRNGNVINYYYGAYGIKLESSMVGESKETSYNSLGLVTGTIDDYRGEKTEESYTYDSFGRMTSKTSADGTVQNYTYDNNANVRTYEMIKNGKSKNSGAYEYDSMNRLTKLDNGDNIFTYTYDNNGNLRFVINGKEIGTDISIMYNQANLPIRYDTDYGGKISTYQTTYFLNGLKYLEQDSVNDIIKDYGYTSRGQLEYEEWMTSSETGMIDYSYDASGNRTQKVEYDYGTSKKEITDYTYDANNRLMQATITSGVPFTGTASGDLTAMTRYYYDPNGNTLAEQNKTYTIDGNAISDMTLSGRSIGNQMKVYEYDDFNRLIKYNDGRTEAEYRYTTDNLRASKTVNGSRTDFVWNGQNLASETKRNVTTTYTYDMTGVITSNRNGAVTRYVKDPHGNVIGTSKNNEIVGEYDYTAFGIQLQSSGGSSNPFRYCGEYYDTELDSVYLRNRYYNPATGRFLTEDPVKDGMNWYSYCGGEPVMLVDPMGLLREGYWDGYGYYHDNPDAEEFGKDSLVYSSLVTLGNMWQLRPDNRADIADLANRVREIGRQKTFNIKIKIAVKAAPESANATDVVLAAGDLDAAYSASVCKQIATEKANKLYPNSSADGSQNNALKHTLWNALMTVRLGKKYAQFVGNAHEFGAEENYAQDKWQQDLMNMDLYNNGKGRTLGESRIWYGNYIDKMANEIVNMINNGQIWVVDWKN